MYKNNKTATAFYLGIAAAVVSVVAHPPIVANEAAAGELSLGRIVAQVHGSTLAELAKQTGEKKEPTHGTAPLDRTAPDLDKQAARPVSLGEAAAAFSAARSHAMSSFAYRESLSAPRRRASIGVLPLASLYDRTPSTGETLVREKSMEGQGGAVMASRKASDPELPAGAVAAPASADLGLGGWLASGWPVRQERGGETWAHLEPAPRLPNRKPKAAGDGRPQIETPGLDVTGLLRRLKTLPAPAKPPAAKPRQDDVERLVRVLPPRKPSRPSGNGIRLDRLVKTAPPSRGDSASPVLVIKPTRVRRDFDAAALGLPIKPGSSPDELAHFLEGVSETPPPAGLWIRSDGENMSLDKVLAKINGTDKPRSSGLPSSRQIKRSKLVRRLRQVSDGQVPATDWSLASTVGQLRRR